MEQQIVSKEIFAKRFSEMLDSSSETTYSIADRLSLTPASISRYANGIMAPKVPTVYMMASIFNVNPLWLMGYDAPKFQKDESSPLYSSEAMKLAKDYDGLDTHGQKAVRAVADVEKARCAEAAQTAPALEPEETVYYITSWFYHPMSAGTGEQAERDQPKSLRLVKEPPRGTSYVAPINDDSMKPTYHNGDRLFIHACEEIEPGQIGVFYMDGQQWVKELGDGELISHNPDYPPRPMTEDIRCQGLVLGVCDDSYFE